MKTEQKRDWKPVLKGGVYCSPACGCGCKANDFAEAIKRAKESVSILGPGWKREVWENGGWHSKVISPCGRVAVYIPTKGEDNQFWADSRIGGDQITTYGKTALEAIAAIEKAVATKLEDLVIPITYRK